MGRSPVKAAMAPVSAPWMVGPVSWICQPTYGVPSYSMVSLYRGISMQHGCGHDRRAAQKLVGGHRLLAGALQLLKAHGAGAAGHRQPVVQHLARRPAASAPGRAQNFDPAGTGKFAPGAGKRRQPAAMVMDLVPRLRPVDARLALVDLVGVGHAACGL